MSQLWKVVDSEGKILARNGLNHCLNVKRVLLAEPCDISEEDENNYGEYLLNDLSWTGTLTIMESNEEPALFSFMRWLHYLAKIKRINR